MRCPTVRDLLLRSTGNDRPLPQLESIQMRAHLARCGACRREWQRLQRLTDMASRLPAPVLPSELRARVLADIAAAPVPVAGSPADTRHRTDYRLPLRVKRRGSGSSPADARQRKDYRLMRRSLIAGVGLTALLGAFLLLAPHSRKSGTVLAMGDVQKALEHVNTWHLKGWKREGDKQIPWEVWGRKTPFFYHERVGGQETLDDGRERTIVFAPDAKSSTHGVALKIPSRPDAESSVGLSFLLGMDKGKTNQSNRRSENADTETYEVPEMTIGGRETVKVSGLLTFVKGSTLPIRYERINRLYAGQKDATGHPVLFETPESAKQKEWISSHLEGHYDAPLDEEAFQIAAPADYQRINAVQDAVSPVIPRQNAATTNGLTMHVTQALVDPKGHVLLQFEGFVGGVNFRDAHLPFGWDTDVRYNETLGRPRFPWQRAGENAIVAVDEKERPYVAVNGLEFLGYTGNRAWLALAPLTPLTPGESLPRSLSFAMQTTLDTYQPLPELNGGTALSFMKESLLFKDVELPRTAQSIDLLAFSKRYGTADNVAGRGFATTFDEAAATARAEAWQELARTAIGQGRVLVIRADGTRETRPDPDKQREAKKSVQQAARYTDAALPLIPKREQERLKSNMDGVRKQFATQR